MSTQDLVLTAVQAEFNVARDKLRPDLKETPSGRVYGAITIHDDAFAELTPSQWSRRLWDRLRNTAGAEATNVGVIYLLSAPAGRS